MASARSHNGWSVIRGGLWPLPAVTGSVRAGAVWVVFHWLAKQYSTKVEKITRPHSWGYAYRQVRGGRSWSNHASGTAVDFNAPAHPLGKRGTMTAKQAAACRAIERASGGILNWGDNIPDEMHWEITRGTPPAKVEAFATRLLQQALNRHGAGLTVNDDRDPKMVAALKRFQVAAGLQDDGVDGPKTWAALDKAPVNPTPEPEPEEPEVPTEPDVPVDPTPEPEPQPEPTPPVAEFVLGVANCQSYDGAKTEKAWRDRAAIFARQGWSVVCVVETTEDGRSTMLAELKKLTGHKWKTWTLADKTVAIMWDDAIWSNRSRRVTTTWSPFGHGGVCAPLTHRKTGLGVDVISHHTPPSSVATNARKDAAIAASAKLKGSWPTVLAGDFNRAAPSLPDWVRATPKVDTVDKPGSQAIDAAFIRGPIGAGKTTVINPGGLSDHRWLSVPLILAQPTT